MSETPKTERISKVMARAGLCSRRDAERWIEAGRVAVNGKTLTSPALNVSETDVIEVDSKRLDQKEASRLFMYHKPAGCLTTNADPQGRPTIFSILPKGLPRLIAVGRLDYNTEGLLLMTNDGALSHYLESPKVGLTRRYRVRAYGKVEQKQLDRLKDGITVSGINYGSIKAVLEKGQGGNVWIDMTLTEGKNREIKKVLEAMGLQVNRLIRVSYGGFELRDLPKGSVMEVPEINMKSKLRGFFDA